MSVSGEADRVRRLHDEYDEHLALTERAELELRADADELQAQEGWDRATREGVQEWLADRGNIWRALRRNRYDAGKTHALLLAALAARVSLELHLPIPAAAGPVFYILPLPRFTDRAGRPVAVLALRHVVRDETGLDGLKDWMWWALEMTRRALRDWRAGGWQRGAAGHGADGAVLVVDAGGAGYRNMEVELLPSLFQIGHNNFPGLFQSVLVVNAGWSQRAMWGGVVKRVLPRSALDKVSFVQTRAELEAVFDPARLPRELGGDDPWAYAGERDVVWERYAAGGVAPEPAGTVPRAASGASLADIWFSARNSPVASRAITRQASTTSVHAHARPLSRTASHGHMHGLGILGLGRMGMTAARRGAADGTADGDGVGHTLDAVNARLAAGAPEGRPRSGRATPKRIKSLSDFHLYLSPSRLAHRDLLSDSDDDDAGQRRLPTPQILAARSSAAPLSARRVRPALRVETASNGQAAGTAQPDRAYSSYSSRLLAHHARGVELYSHGHGSDAQATPSPSAAEAATATGDGACEPASGADPAATTTAGAPDRAQLIPLYSASNPWFGYPAELVRSPHGVSVRPRYARNRKRDLLKTLLFLFTLRVQAWRDALERALGLWPAGRADADGAKASNPAEGLVSRRGRAGAPAGWDRDWVWMVLGLLVLRGTWLRIVSAPLEWLGLDPIRFALGV